MWGGVLSSSVYDMKVNGFAPDDLFFHPPEIFSKMLKLLESR